MKKYVLTAILFFAVGWLVFDVVRFPECYSTTLKYQLQNELERGDAKAIEYYNHVYVESGRELFD